MFQIFIGSVILAAIAATILIFWPEKPSPQGTQLSNKHTELGKLRKSNR